MTDDEIGEIVDMHEEKDQKNEYMERELQEMQEIGRLEGQASRGELDEGGEERLRKMRGVVYSFRFNGQQVLVNHCFISKLVMGDFILFAAASVIYIALFVKPI